MLLGNGVSSQRLLEQWDALNLYFQSMPFYNILTAMSIHEGLRIFKLWLYYLFLGYIILVVNGLIMEFQSKSF